jgi:outer membrane protein assembly factor BamB
MRHQRIIRPIWGLSIVVGLALGMQSPAAAQLRLPFFGGANSTAEKKADTPEDVFLPPDRGLMQQLSLAQSLLRDQRYSDAIESLDKILDASEDYFIKSDKDVSSSRGSLKLEAQRLIGQMPESGLKLYQVKFGKQAANDLAAAKRSGDADAIARISRRYFYTPAGQEATFLLGLDHFDRDRPMAAALTFQRLRDSAGASNLEAFEPSLSLMQASCSLKLGMPDTARELLQKLKNGRGGAAPVVGGKQVAWFDNAEQSIDWLRKLTGGVAAAPQMEIGNWAMIRGNPARNATGGGAPLLNRQWNIPPSSDNPRVDATIRNIRQIFEDQEEVAVLPGLQPLVVGDLVLMRTPRQLLAVNLITGRRLWESAEGAADRALFGLLESERPRQLHEQLPLLWSGIWRRMSSDATYGAISSDGERVFAVENSLLETAKRDDPFGDDSPSNSNDHFNRLTAYNLHNGKIVWNLGGPPGKLALPEAETYFFGAPLPLMGRLYVLAERKGQGKIALLALDANKGNVLWRQSLATTERDTFNEEIRRTAGMSPSYSDGILVCPTSVGAVVAVDLVGRSLLWGFNYQRTGINVRDPDMGGMIVGSSSAGQSFCADSLATIAGGRVLLAPPDSDSLYCLNLADGKMLWSSDRQNQSRQDLYLACVTADKAVLVGRREVRAVSMSETFKEDKTVEGIEISGSRAKQFKKKTTHDSPKPLWDGRTLPLPSMPSGRGFLTGDIYYLPLSGGQIAAIDINAGRIVHTSQSRDAIAPGNLVAYKGKIISQGFDGLDLYRQLEAARAEADGRLAANARDCEALSLRGDILLDEGKTAEAIDSYREACKSAATADKAIQPRAKLRDLLMDGLKTDFATYRDKTAEIESLLDEEAHRVAYNRLMIEGLRKSGETLAAFRQCEKLIEMDKPRDELELIERNYSVRHDRWVQSQLSALRSDAKNPEDLAAIDRSVAERLETAVRSQTAEPLRRFLDYFGHEPCAASARRELTKRLADSGRLLEAEMLLWKGWLSSEKTVAGPVVGELAEMLRKARQDEDASICYKRLAEEFADTVCLDGKTGKQMVDALPPDSPIREMLSGNDAWPAGLVEAETRAVAAPTRQSATEQAVMRFKNSTQPFYFESQIRYAQNQRALTSYNGWGAERWRLPVGNPDASNTTIGRSIPIDRETSAWLLDSFGARELPGFIQGHLLVAPMNDELLSIDMLGGGRGSPKLLWRQKIGGASDDMNFLLESEMFGLPSPDEEEFDEMYNPGRNFCPIVVGGRCVCFQRNRTIVALDSLSGEPLWSRDNMPAGCHIFGDDDFLFALPPNKSEAFVYKTTDGQLLGKRAIPLGGIASNSKASSSPIPGAGNAERLNNYSFPEVCRGTLGRNLVLWRRQANSNKFTLTLFDPWEGRNLWPEKTFSSSSELTLWMLRDGEFLIKDAKGEITMIDVSDGKTIFNAKFGGGSIFGLSISRISGWYEDRYLDNHIVAVIPENTKQPAENIAPLPGGKWIAMRPGLIWAFDSQGKPLWPEPVKIQNQFLLDDQPFNLPVLVFACQEFDSPADLGIGRRGGIANRGKISIMCLDKRTGRIVYPADPKEGKLSTPPSMIEIVGDPKQHTMELRLQQQVISLKFTDKPLPPQPKASAAGSSAAGSSAAGANAAGGNAAGGNAAGGNAAGGNAGGGKTSNGLIKALESLLRKPPQSESTPAQPPPEAEK